MTFIDNLPELAWTARPDGHIDYYNRRWYEYTGTTFEEMQGWGWEKVHDPQLLPKVVERWKHSLATGEPFEMEFTLRGADGDRALVPHARRTAASDSSGTIVRWFGTNTNIDAIKASQALTEAMAEQSRETRERAPSNEKRQGTRAGARRRAREGARFERNERVTDPDAAELREFTLAKIARVLGRSRAEAILNELLLQLGIELNTPQDLLRLGEGMTRREGFEGAVGAMLTVAAVLRGAHKASASDASA